MASSRSDDTPCSFECGGLQKISEKCEADPCEFVRRGLSCCVNSPGAVAGILIGGVVVVSSLSVLVVILVYFRKRKKAEKKRQKKILAAITTEDLERGDFVKPQEERGLAAQMAREWNEIESSSEEEEFDDEEEVEEIIDETAPPEENPDDRIRIPMLVTTDDGDELPVPALGGWSPMGGMPAPPPAEGDDLGALSIRSTSHQSPANLSAKPLQNSTYRSSSPSASRNRIEVSILAHSGVRGNTNYEASVLGTTPARLLAASNRSKLSKSAYKQGPYAGSSTFAPSKKFSHRAWAGGAHELHGGSSVRPTGYIKPVDPFVVPEELLNPSKDDDEFEAAARGSREEKQLLTAAPPSRLRDQVEAATSSSSPAAKYVPMPSDVDGPQYDDDGGREEEAFNVGTWDPAAAQHSPDADGELRAQGMQRKASRKDSFWSGKYEALPDDEVFGGNLDSDEEAGPNSSVRRGKRTHTPPPTSVQEKSLPTAVSAPSSEKEKTVAATYDAEQSNKAPNLSSFKPMTLDSEQQSMTNVMDETQDPPPMMVEEKSLLALEVDNNVPNQEEVAESASKPSLTPAEVKTRRKALGKLVKDWKVQFLADRGREPTKKEMKADPSIAGVYAEWKGLPVQDGDDEGEQVAATNPPAVQQQHGSTFDEVDRRRKKQLGKLLNDWKKKFKENNGGKEPSSREIRDSEEIGELYGEWKDLQAAEKKSAQQQEELTGDPPRPSPSEPDPTHLKKKQPQSLNQGAESEAEADQAKQQKRKKELGKQLNLWKKKFREEHDGKDPSSKDLRTSEDIAGVYAEWKSLPSGVESGGKDHQSPVQVEPQHHSIVDPPASSDGAQKISPTVFDDAARRRKKQLGKQLNEWKKRFAEKNEGREPSTKEIKGSPEVRSVYAEWKELQSAEKKQIVSAE